MLVQYVYLQKQKKISLVVEIFEVLLTEIIKNDCT